MASRAETSAHSSGAPESPLAAAGRLAPRIRARAAEIERVSTVPADLVKAMVDADLFRIVTPRSVGGLETDLPTYIETMYLLGQADGSTAWCLNQATAWSISAAYMPIEHAREVFGRADSIMANGPVPNGRAVLSGDSYVVTGRWPFGSGVDHATWLSGYSTIVDAHGRPIDGGDGPENRYMFFPAAEGSIIPNWNVTGMRGTGSHDFAADRVLVPRRRSVAWQTDRPREEGPLYRFPFVCFAASGFGAVALGIARAAIDEFHELAGGKTPRGMKAAMRDLPMVQAQLAHAEAEQRAGLGFLRDTIAENWQHACRTGELRIEQRALLRLAATHAFHAADRAMDIVYKASGVTAIFVGTPLYRYRQDLNVATQHIQARLAHYEMVGRVLFGLDPESTFL